MKIVIIAPSAMPSRRANTIQTAKMAQAFARLGHQIFLIVPTLSPRLFRSKAKGGKSENSSAFWQSFSHHYGLTTPFHITHLSSFPAFKRYDFALQSLIFAHHWHADLIYTRLPQAASLSSLLGIKTIFEIHDFPQGNAAKSLKIFIRGKGALRLVTITHALAQALIQTFPQILNTPPQGALSPFLIIAPDGVDLDRYTPWLTVQQARQKLQAQGFSVPNQFIAGYSGHLYAGRGIELILEIARQLPNILFLLIGGEDADLQRLKAILEQQNLPNLRSLGFIPNTELPLYQMACDTLLMPYQEKVAASSGGNIAAYLSPMKLFEYLASGRPILSSNLPVIGEILNSTNAILLPPREPIVWAAALQKLQDSPSLRQQLSEAARQTALKYKWEERARYILAAGDERYC